MRRNTGQKGFLTMNRESKSQAFSGLNYRERREASPDLEVISRYMCSGTKISLSSPVPLPDAANEYD